jgi:hypothetical protein
VQDETMVDRLKRIQEGGSTLDETSSNNIPKTGNIQPSLRSSPCTLLALPLRGLGRTSLIVILSHPHTSFCRASLN